MPARWISSLLRLLGARLGGVRVWLLVLTVYAIPLGPVAGAVLGWAVLIVLGVVALRDALGEELASRSALEHQRQREAIAWDVPAGELEDGPR